MSNAAIMTVGDQRVESATTLQQRVAAVHAAYQGVMQPGVHYGVIPGTGSKPTLLKPGAEMLCTQFRLVPSYEVTRADLPGGHREYGVTCTLTKLDTGQVWAQGVGLCTTMESKYRYRWKGPKGNRHREENQDIADTYNTVLKMAKKRALVDATLTATGCSDMFTQDVEDFAQPGSYEVPSTSEPVAQPAPRRNAGAYMEPVRRLITPWRKARGLSMEQAIAELAERTGASSMQAMTEAQAGQAMAIMSGEIAPARAISDADPAVTASSAGGHVFVADVPQDEMEAVREEMRDGDPRAIAQEELYDEDEVW